MLLDGLGNMKVEPLYEKWHIVVEVVKDVISYNAPCILYDLLDIISMLEERFHFALHIVVIEQ